MGVCIYFLYNIQICPRIGNMFSAISKKLILKIQYKNTNYVTNLYIFCILKVYTYNNIKKVLKKYILVYRLKEQQLEQGLVSLSL